MTHLDADCWWQHSDASLGSTREADEYRRWSATRGYRVELAALILAEEGHPNLPGRPVPNGKDYALAAEIVRALDGPQ